MGTIRARVSDELEEKIEKIIEDVRKEAVLGSEINLSTVIRYALDNYIKEYEERKKEILTVKFDLKAINDKEKLEKLQEATKQLSEVFSVGYAEEVKLGVDLFELNNAINYRLFELNKRGE